MECELHLNKAIFLNMEHKSCVQGAALTNGKMKRCIRSNLSSGFNTLSEIIWDAREL